MELPPLNMEIVEMRILRDENLRFPMLLVEPPISEKYANRQIGNYPPVN